MTPPVATFLLSLVVSLISIPFASDQVKELLAAINQVRPAKADAAGLDDLPEIPKTYIAQSIEIAYAFPSMVLTLIAFGDLLKWSGLSGAILLCLGVAGTWFLGWFMKARQVDKYQLFRIGRVSGITIVLTIANLAGLLISIYLLLTPEGEPAPKP